MLLGDLLLSCFQNAVQGTLLEQILYLQMALALDVCMKRIMNLRRESFQT